MKILFFIIYIFIFIIPSVSYAETYQISCPITHIFQDNQVNVEKDIGDIINFEVDLKNETILFETIEHKNGEVSIFWILMNIVQKEFDILNAESYIEFNKYHFEIMYYADSKKLKNTYRDIKTNEKHGYMSFTCIDKNNLSDII